MILETFSLIAPAVDAPSWTLEEESLAHDMDLIFSFGSCHCGPKLCAKWRAKIMAKQSGYEYGYALHMARTQPVRN